MEETTIDQFTENYKEWHNSWTYRNTINKVWGSLKDLAWQVAEQQVLLGVNYGPSFQIGLDNDIPDLVRLDHVNTDSTWTYEDLRWATLTQAERVSIKDFVVNGGLVPLINEAAWVILENANKNAEEVTGVDYAKDLMVEAIKKDNRDEIRNKFSRMKNDRGERVSRY